MELLHPLMPTLKLWLELGLCLSPVSPTRRLLIASEYFWSKEEVFLSPLTDLASHLFFLFRFERVPVEHRQGDRQVTWNCHGDIFGHRSGSSSVDFRTSSLLPFLPLADCFHSPSLVSRWTEEFFGSKHVLTSEALVWPNHHHFHDFDSLPLR